MLLQLTLGLILICIVFYIIGVYNNLVSLRTRIQASIQEIGNQLKRQAELLPNLEISAKAYLKHEKDILKMLADARKLISSGKDATAKVAEILPKIQVVVESNPQMKGADVISQLMSELRDTSDKVMYSRRTLIDITADYNIKLVSFPSNFIASTFGFHSEKGLEVSETETKTPKLSL